MNTSPTTKDDKQVISALAIRSVATDLKSFDKALEVAIEIMNDPGSFSKNKRLQSAKALRDLKRCISTSSDRLFQNVKVLDPVPSLDYVHKRQKQPVLQDITNKRSLSTGPASSSNASSSKRGKKSTSAVLPTRLHRVGLPPPQNGTHYTKLEFFKILTNPTAEHGLLNRIIEEGLVPVKRRQALHLLKGYRDHGIHLKNLHKPWGETGREPILEFKDVQEITIDLQAKSGYCLGKENVEDILAEKQKQNMLARGIQPLAPTTSCSQTVQNYKSWI
jgi:hypothetical protein